MTHAQQVHEELIERARQDLLSAVKPHQRRVAADHFRSLCLLRDPCFAAQLERDRMARARA